MDVKLVMFKADGTRRDFALSKPRTVIGRTNTADLRIPLSSVSRQHCEITISDEAGVRVRDLGSSNGTHHNGTRIQESKLEPGDQLLIGPVLFTIVIDGQPEEIEPVHTVLDDLGQPQGAAQAEAPEAPQKIEKHEEGMVEEEVEAETYTPTVDLDDPLAALQKLSEQSANPDDEPIIAAEVEDDDDDIPLLADDEDDDIPLLADDDEESKQA